VIGVDAELGCEELKDVDQLYLLDGSGFGVCGREGLHNPKTGEDVGVALGAMPGSCYLPNAEASRVVSVATNGVVGAWRFLV